MANVVQSEESVVPENLRKQLAVALKSIQWSYAIFWSLSLEEQGVLEWGDGYYNGDIKTRKTMQAVDVKADKTGLLRSDKLRELYKSLLHGETDQPNKRPSASLSPEDLSDAEWYYLVCMSFVFNPGQSLPGRALANGETIWLCNAQYADNKVFSRSLLAKSASIQTVVCFPHFGGVIELGTTDLVVEDLSLIQHVKASLLDFSKPFCSSEISSPTPHGEDNDSNPASAVLNHEMVDTMVLELDSAYSPPENTTDGKEGSDKLYGSIHDVFKMDSSDDCSSGCEHTLWTEDSIMPESSRDGGSLLQNCQSLEKELKKGIQESINPSECLSQAFLNEEKDNITQLLLKELEEGDNTKLKSLNPGVIEDLQYIRTLYSILRSSNQLIGGSKIDGGYRSSFVSWKKGVAHSHSSVSKQNLLKKILFGVPSMHAGHSTRSDKENAGQDCMHKLKSNEIACDEYISSDNHKESEKFQVLRSIVPSIGKLDKESALDEMVKYLKELEARVEELESCMDSGDNELRPRKSSKDTIKQISDNHDLKKIDYGKQSWINKRKACNIDKAMLQLNDIDQLSSDVKVSVKDKEVQIEMKCSHREYILLDIMDEVNKLYLDAHSVQSSTIDGILYLTMKSKFQGPAVAPAGMIKQALLKITGNS